MLTDISVGKHVANKSARLYQPPKEPSVENAASDESFKNSLSGAQILVSPSHSKLINSGQNSPVSSPL